MPLYDFECPHGHRFEKNVPIADMQQPIPCEGLVNQFLDDDELEELKSGMQGDSANVPVVDLGKIELVPLVPGKTNGSPIERVAVVKVQCILKAHRVEISFSRSNRILDHGMATNRDAAREGRYDPLNPNRRFMAKGRSWRK